ncbi:hypothetical protein PHISCL_07988 [Aspergillus sclerotialis]|uniref:Uncharacterized protein n=1 Tax=Aspergillus sclerotialis TaxID=2070753 RepID=A0A3A2Z966_9EURO|nr:hypothetical protein PHISCL_07988 [Aspergillus sclerotialis]
MKLTDWRSRFSFLQHQRQEHAASPQNEQPPATPDQGTSQAKPRELRGLELGFEMPYVNEEIAELLKTTDHMLTQLHEVERLRQLKDPVMNADERKWASSTIKDMANAIRDVTVLVEPTRVEQETRNGKLSLGRQLLWVYRDSRRARDMTRRLLACHHSLMTVLNHFQHLDIPESAIAHELETDMSSDIALSRQSDRRRPSSEFPGPTDDGVEGIGPKIDYEMLNLLSWRRSKGSSTQVNPHPGHNAEKRDISLE